jgi:hypothetical protein
MKNVHDIFAIILWIFVHDFKFFKILNYKNVSDFENMSY